MYARLMETATNLVLSPTKKQAENSSTMDSNHDDLIIIEDSDDNSNLTSQSVHSVDSSSPDNFTAIVELDASSSQEDQRKKEEQKLPRNENSRSLSIEEDLSPPNRNKLNRKSDKNGTSKDEHFKSIQKDSLDKPLKLIRKFENSNKYNTAIRIDQKNISKEVIKGILLDSLEGEFILAQYQSQQHLDPNLQQKLVDILISRSSSDLLDLKKLSNYFPNLADAILGLFPNEDRETYYMAPSTPGNKSIFSKGMLVDEWHRLKKDFRKYGMIAVTSSISKDPECVDKSKGKTNIHLTDEVKKDMKWLAGYTTEPIAEVKKRWEATYEYRYQTRTTEPRCLTEYLKEWPILTQCDTLIQWLIGYDFEKNFKSCKPSKFMWGRLFNELYNQRSSVVSSECEGWIFIDFYKKSSTQELNSVQLERLHMLILPYLLLAPNEPTSIESASGFVIWSKTKECSIESICRALEKRNEPCLVIEGESADCLHSCYVYIHNVLLKVPSPLEALDLLFKFYMAFNLKFPVDCTTIWLVIVQVLYNVRPGNYNITPNIQLLCKELKAKLEIDEVLEG